MRDLLIGVSQVEVDLTLGAAGRFSFTVVDTLQPSRSATFLLGQRRRRARHADVRRRGRDRASATATRESAPIAVTGMITEITTSFPEGGSPELAVAGYDHVSR